MKIEIDIPDYEGNGLLLYYDSEQRIIVEGDTVNKTILIRANQKVFFLWLVTYYI